MAKLFSLARNAAAAIAVGALLAGCLVPETIDADIVLEGHKYDMRVETRLALASLRRLPTATCSQNRKRTGCGRKSARPLECPVLRASPMPGEGALIS